MHRFMLSYGEGGQASRQRINKPVGELATDEVRREETNRRRRRRRIVQQRQRLPDKEKGRAYNEGDLRSLYVTHKDFDRLLERLRFRFVASFHLKIAESGEERGQACQKRRAVA